MKNLLIISPNFPPINAADMHRVRQSLMYFQELDWNPIVLTVKPEQIEGNIDENLLQTISPKIEIIHVSAFSPRWTRKIGLGSLGLRSLWFYKNAGNKILKTRKIDLIYFSTTMFPVMILGTYWEKKFSIPFVIDMQDPWHSEHYLKVPKHQRPPKFWFSYRLNKYLEPIAMKKVSGIISVSQGYCDILQQRYTNIRPENCTVIPFGAFRTDFEVLEQQKILNSFFSPGTDTINIAYIGRGGHDMELPISAICKAFKRGLVESPELFKRIKMYFIGTSYAKDGKGKATIEPLAQKFGVDQYIKEFTDRVSYFEALQILREADMLLIPGSVDPNYTASKLYPYIMAQKPLLAVFNEQSSVVEILKRTNAGEAIVFNGATTTETLATNIYESWQNILLRLPFIPDINWTAFEPYTAKKMTEKQVNFFDMILKAKSALHEHSECI
ncbi:glycosyltransferase [Rhodocytophaga aerolata]|uniref:Glycosyltransferase n=1 Tax=Rhodocytophaga aerolata TaxID=455078 RepID=A0ABT8RF33_9BACT|nr:glycosyltransferase [Rhodocytophaga aerolata]MDO1449798.1 glycosyltransferase [Rhodocytophaga aerolata]